MAYLSDVDDAAMMEGFICPTCMKRFDSPDLLLNHFENDHSEATDVLKSLRGLFGYAKKKILSFDDKSPDGSTSSSSNTDLKKKAYTVNFYELCWPPQNLGATRSHTQFFKVTHDDRFGRLSSDIDILIVRLGKLLTNMPTDPIKKKTHEQNIVPWLDGKDVTRCPNCTKSFNFTKRQHHCRLCGCIMCHDCSFFLPLNKAKQILAPDDTEEYSISSSPISNTDLKLRVCSYCLQMLESRELIKENRNTRPFLCELYDEFIGSRDEANKLSDMYLEMMESILAGETKYYASDAMTLRVKLVRLADHIDGISKKIAALSTNNNTTEQCTPNNSTSSSTIMTMSQRLHKSIRAAAVGYIRTKLLTLPNVPTAEKLKELQEKRRLEMETKRREDEIKELRKREDSYNVETHHSSGVNNNGTKSNENNVVKLDTWSPANTAKSSSNDPLVQQISNIKLYIKEARMAHKYIEVGSLELNLKELQDEYFRRQQLEHREDS